MVPVRKLSLFQNSIIPLWHTAELTIVLDCLGQSHQRPGCPEEWECRAGSSHPARLLLQPLLRVPCSWPPARQGVPATGAERETRVRVGGEERREDTERGKKKNNKVGERRGERNNNWLMILTKHTNTTTRNLKLSLSNSSPITLPS